MMSNPRIAARHLFRPETQKSPAIQPKPDDGASSGRTPLRAIAGGEESP